jgi:isopentenyl diphosphate isomerase/L-lactate dehydrogenase-like FMN-dependent dehydrogenase
MIFARDITGPLTSLVKKIDAINADNPKIGSFVVFMSDEEKLADNIKDLAKNAGLKKTVLTLDNPTGPQAYKIAKDADVTVVLYNNRNVKANFAFRKGELNDAAVEKIISAVNSKLTK